MSNDGQETTPPIPSSSEVSLGVRIDKVCGEFEEHLKAGNAPKIETYLSQVPEDHQCRLLEELLGLELDYRAKAGDSFTSEEYTLRFPEHASSVAQLVVNVRQSKPANAEVASKNAARQTPPTNRQADSSASTQRSGTNGPVRIGPYEIIEPCGRGGMGVVYKAWHELFKQYRAIKVLPSDFDDDDISRFSMEIELAGRLNHPNIVRAHEANREQGVLYLVMEFVDGINLDHLVKHHKRLPLGLACEMIRQAAEGLQHAHEHFLVHRDIKPSNLMINQQGQVKILDFGLARLHAEQHASRLTKHGSVMGTLDFMAPEQWEDPMGATIQADIYSLGCTLYYLITGTPPYGGEDYSHWLKKQEAHRKSPVPKIEHEQGEALQPIINRMMAKSKSERFQSPAEVVEALALLADGSELTKYAGTPSPVLSTSGISRTPIPTVNVSTSELVERPFEQFPGDSEPNSGAKTMRPHQSRTDIDSDVQKETEPEPPKPPWHKSLFARVSLSILAVVLLAAAWFVFRPPQNVELAEQMGALPGLNGGLNGDWWFAEMPWYTPGVRKAFMEALRNGESEIAGVPLDNWEERLASSDTQSLQRDLKDIAEELKSRLPDPEQTWAGRILEASNLRDPEEYEGYLLKILTESLPTGEAELDLSSSTFNPTQLHLLANILHNASTNNSQYAARTGQVYLAAIEAYDEDAPIDLVLQAVARSDYSRFLADRREYSASIELAKRARKALPQAGLFQISLHCELADQYRKFSGDSVLALEQVKTATIWADEIPLAKDHPLRAEILERRAWVNVDGWHMREAVEDFEAATRIREANQRLGNEFAWRSILLNLQGQAMALHFLGLDDDAEVKYKQLEGEASKTDLGPLYGSDAERSSRLPNIRERLGDVYLFDEAGRYGDAVSTYGKAANAALRQRFQNSATLWFHLTRLYYKQWLAQMLAGNDSDAPGYAAAANPKEKAKLLESTFRAQIADEAAYQKQAAAFDLEKRVALAIESLQQADSDESLKAALEELLSISETDENRVNRGNVEVLLLVFDELFKRHDQLPEPIAVNQLVDRLLVITEEMRAGDPAIRTNYLKRVFDRAELAFNKLDPKLRDTDLPPRLNNAIPEAK